MEKNSEHIHSHDTYGDPRRHKFTGKGVIALILGPLILGIGIGMTIIIVFLSPIVRVFEAVRGEIFIGQLLFIVLGV